jgi:hypothetical protein
VSAEEGRGSVVVTLVHGTFGRLPGRDAAWARDGSFFRRCLTEALGGDIAFRTFRWSGMNWPSARYRAGRRLRDHCRETANRYPERSHYLVAHSHGGNVALYALRDFVDHAPADALPAGVICLSTPFITAQPRPVTLFRFVATYTVILVATFAVVAALMGRLLVPWLARLAAGSPELQALVWNEVWAEFALCAVLSWRATHALVRLARARRKLIDVRRVPVPIRIYRSIGDEATAVLVTSSLLTWIGTLAWRVASALTIVVTGVFAGLAGVLLAAPIAVALLLERLVSGSRLRRRLAAAARSRGAWAVLVTVGTMLAFAVWGFLFAGTALGGADRSYATLVAGLALGVVACSALSGLGYGLTAPFLEVSAETTPMGSWQVHLFAGRAWEGDERDGLAGAAVRSAMLVHSAAYGDSGVIGDIADWIRAREASANDIATVRA